MADRTDGRPAGAPGVAARKVAVEVLGRIEREGAYANLALGPALERSGLDARDRGLVTELVYGTTRMRAACDWLVDRFVSREIEDSVRTVLRLGAYQLVFLGVPAHAAVSSTVAVAPGRARGFVNAILRRVAEAGPPDAWPDEATELSVPAWLLARLVADLGHDDAIAALESMNRPATIDVREDGYIQDRASQWLVDALPLEPGDVVVDLCAAPGGKATGMAARGAAVLAVDLAPHRAALVVDNARRTGTGPASLGVVVADGTCPPVRQGAATLVLVDAPCSGLGVLRRRADARWRIDEEDIDRLVALQRSLVDAAVALLAPGGVLAYSVCTLTAAETVGIDEHLGAAHPELDVVTPPPAPWRPRGRGAVLLPQDADTDGMALLLLRRPR